MAPTIQPGEFVLGNPLEPGDVSIKRYDVILFQPPIYSNHVFAMRVVGLPGEHLVLRTNSLQVDRGEIAVGDLPVVLRGQNWRWRRRTGCGMPRRRSPFWNRGRPCAPCLRGRRG